jgi:hypothetical protein
VASLCIFCIIDDTYSVYESIRVECRSVSLCGYYRHLRVLVAAHDLYIDTRQLCIFRGALRPAPSLLKFYYFVNLDKYDHPGPSNATASGGCIDKGGLHHGVNHLKNTSKKRIWDTEMALLCSRKFDQAKHQSKSGGTLRFPIPLLH